MISRRAGRRNACRRCWRRDVVTVRWVEQRNPPAAARLEVPMMGFAAFCPSYMTTILDRDTILEATMSAPLLRRVDKQMSDERTQDLLARGFCGRIANVGADGWPYCVP